MLDAGRSGGGDDDGQNRSPKFPHYARGVHVPHANMVDQAERLVSGSAACLNHVLWEVLRLPWQSLEKKAADMLRWLSPEVQKLVLDSANRIRLESGHHFLRALERRRSLDGLAALTLLLRLAIERQQQEQIKEYAYSVLRMLLVLGEMLIEHGVGEMLFDLYAERIFPLVTFDGLVFDLSDYPYALLARELQFQVMKTYIRARFPDRQDHSDKIITNILAGQYAAFFKVLSEPLLIPNIAVGPPAPRAIEHLAEQRRLKEAAMQVNGLNSSEGWPRLTTSLAPTTDLIQPMMMFKSSGD